MSTGGALRLDGAHAVVAGAASPLARGLAVTLAEAGAVVSVTTLRDDPAEETLAHSIVNECWSFGRDGRVRRVTLADPAATLEAFADLERELAPIELMVVPVPAQPPDIPAPPALEATLTHWYGALSGVTTAFVAAQAAARRMLAHGRGRVVLVLPAPSPDARSADALGEAARAAVLALVRALDVEWAGGGVRVRALGVRRARPASVAAVASTAGLREGLARVLSEGGSDGALQVVDYEYGAAGGPYP